MIISNSQESNDAASQFGFTLIEILLTVLLFGTLGTIATYTLSSLLRGASKTEFVKEVKQNGDYALSVMEVKLRNAGDISSTCTGVSSTSVQIDNPDTTTRTIFSCVTNSGTRRIQEEVQDLTGTTLSTNYLTNTSISTPNSCADVSFTCSQSAATGKKNIAVSFTLTQSGVLSEAERVLQTFQLQVSLRN